MIDRETLEKLAREAGFEVGPYGIGVPQAHLSDGLVDAPWLYEAIAAVAQKAAEAEREAIAAWIDPQRNDIPACGFEFAAAIRARGTGGAG